ncbi:hypothetical protein N9D61_04040 [Planktomarina sp.]|jgi:hypothetical protein|nr:hypothetical protein [Planktomarina sp.]
MKTAVIFSLERSNNEPQYEALSVLLTKSIRETSPETDIYCGIFTNRQPSQSIIKQLQSYDVNILKDCRFDVEPDSVNYFLRNYCCYYFSHLHNLLEKYDRLIYLDIDVLVLRNISTVNIPDNSVLVEQVPDNILEFEKDYIGTVDHPLYYNWISVINNTNKQVYDIDYKSNTHLKQSDILVSKNINASNLRIIDQDIGAYYPKSKLKPYTVAFHYDGFIDSGSFWRLESIFPQMHKKYSVYAQHVLNITQENNKRFWDDI